MTLTEFLLARIAEDEGQLDAQRDGQSSAEGAGYWSWQMDDALKRHERECEAKRRIVERCAGIIADVEADHSTSQSPDYYGGQADRAEDASATLKELAMPYADHPDYRQEWKP